MNDEATIELEGDSSLIEPLRKLCDDLEDKRYEICTKMLGKGGCYVTMATNSDNEPYHRILLPEDVSVYTISAGKITEIAMIIDRKVIKRQKYTLVRHHVLDNNGTLFIYYYTLNALGNEAFVEEWEHYKQDNMAFYGANHIGVAYFKSPQDSNGLEPFFGVPLNFACAEEEIRLIEAKNMRIKEMQNAQASYATSVLTVCARKLLTSRFAISSRAIFFSLAIDTFILPQQSVIRDIV